MLAYVVLGYLWIVSLIKAAHLLGLRNSATQFSLLLIVKGLLAIFLGLTIDERAIVTAIGRT